MADQSHRGFAAIFSALSNRGFLYYTFGALLSQIGNWVYRIASGWLMWELTHSATWLGILGFSLQAPAILSPIAGAYADRFDRLFLARITQVLLCLQGAVLAALALLDLVTPSLLALLSLTQGIIQSIDQPARYSLYPTLIGPNDLTAAVATDSITFNTARLIGPTIAGYVLHFHGVGPAFVINAVTFALFSLLLCLVKAPKAPPIEAKERNLFREVRDGIKYGVRHPGIGPALALLGISTLLAMPISHLLPGFAAQVFSGGAVELSVLTATMGVGAMTGSLWLARRGHFMGLTAIMVRSLLVSGLSMIAFTATSNFYFALSAAFIIGGCHMIARGSCQTLVQNAVDGAMRGRVMSLFGLIFRGAPAIGALILGTAAEYFGLRVPFAVSGLLLILAWWLSSRRFTNMADVLEVEAQERVR